MGIHERTRARHLTRTQLSHCVQFVCILMISAYHRRCCLLFRSNLPCRCPSTLRIRGICIHRTLNISVIPVSIGFCQPPRPFDLTDSPSYYPDLQDTSASENYSSTTPSSMHATSLHAEKSMWSTSLTPSQATATYESFASEEYLIHE